MKTKLYAFLLATLTSVSVFATRNVVPSDAVLADYYDNGNVCVCIFVPEELACNDIVLTGSFNNWSGTAANCVPFEAIEGYDGWYVASFEPEAEPDAEKGIQAKPVMLDYNGNFNWEYQVVDATIIRGGVQVVAGFLGEIDLINYGADAPNVFTVDAWKSNPCTAIYHNYTVTVINDGCNNLAVPFIVGGMNGWIFQQMQLDQAKTLEYQVPVYTTTFKAAESTSYQILSGLMDTTGQIIEAPGWKDIARMQKLVDEQWVRIPGEDGDNQLTHENANIVWDLRDSTLRWARCEEGYPVKLQVKLPALGCPETVEIIGTFDYWSGTAMELLESGWFFVELEAKASQYFMFRSAGSWDHDIEIYRVANDEWTRVLDNELNFGQLWHDSIYNGMSCKWIEIDMSDPTYYRWGGKYNLNVICDNNKGRVTGSGQYNIGAVLIDATPNYGYHFTHWSDGNTDNPRTIVLTQDTTFTAEFAKNTYTISTISADPQWGTTAGDTTAQYLDEVEISAIPNYGYHFVRWNDYNTSNPRTISVTEDKTYTAIFEQNTYYITKYAENGYISGNSSAGYLDNVLMTAIPNYGYHFVRWGDGVTNNPRSCVITQDTTFTAEFVIDRTGACGDNNALTWSYDATEKTLTITGSGALSSNYTFGSEAPSEMEKLIIAEGVTAIGANAFSNMSTLLMLQLPSTLKTIGDKAFENCIDLTSIYNYRERPCLVSTSAFDGVNKFDCTLYVLAGSVDMYKSAGSNWKDFYYILPIGTAEVTEPVTDVITEPTESTVVLTWPTNDNAASYTIVITKDGVVFCTLIFNANGQLTGIAFAPSRDGSHHAPSALMTANGLQFTVTGLNSNTQYGYSVTAKDSNDQPVATYSGEFTTTSEGVATGVESIQPSEVSIQKILRDGQILILRGEKVYTLQGQEVR